MTNDKSTRGDGYLVWTCGLMAVIIVALVVLWIQQRRRTQQAVRQLNQLSAKRDGQTDEVAEMLRGRMLAHRPIGIDHDVTIGGRPVTALLVRTSPILRSTTMPVSRRSGTVSASTSAASTTPIPARLIRFVSSTISS